MIIGEDPQTFGEGFHAGFYRFAICNNHALRTLSIGTKNPHRGSIFVVMTKYLNSIGV
jgi:hypothetical protein